MKLVRFETVKQGKKSVDVAILSLDSKSQIQKGVNEEIEIDVNEEGVTKRHKGKIKDIFPEQFKAFKPAKKPASPKAAQETQGETTGSA